MRENNGPSCLERVVFKHILIVTFHVHLDYDDVKYDKKLEDKIPTKIRRCFKQVDSNNMQNHKPLQ